MTSKDKFENLSNWNESGSFPWTDLRYTVLNVNLARHLPQRPLQILDAGGGTGRDAIRLAHQGHTITLLDYSDAMLREAQSAAESSGMSERIRFQLGTIEDISTLFPTPQFDVVLFHNVIQYLGDPTDALRAVCHPLLPGGIFSLSSINRYSEAYRQALLHFNLEKAFDLLDQHQVYTETFDTMTTVYAADELTPIVESMGFDVVGNYGVRCVNDYICGNERKYDPDFYAELERLELAMSGRYPYYLLARIFHVIAQKHES